MSSISRTPNLGLSLPPFDYNSLPNWSQFINQNFQIIDSLGAPVAPADININANLPFNGWSATTLGSLIFNINPNDLPSYNCLYDVGGNLVWNDNAGNQIALTAAGSPTGGPSDNGFSGAYYGTNGCIATVSNAGAFSFLQLTNTYAQMNFGRITIFDDTNASTASAITLITQPSTPAYTLNLPIIQPSTLSGPGFMTVSSTGYLSWYQVDGSTLVTSGTTIQVADGGITSTQIADQAVGTAEIAAGAVTLPKLGSIPTIQCYGYVQMTGTSVTDTQTGRFTTTSPTCTAGSTPFGGHAGVKVALTLPTSMSAQDVVVGFYEPSPSPSGRVMYIDEIVSSGTEFYVWFGTTISGSAVDIDSGVYYFSFAF